MILFRHLKLKKKKHVKKNVKVNSACRLKLIFKKTMVTEILLKMFTFSNSLYNNKSNKNIFFFSFWINFKCHQISRIEFFFYIYLWHNIRFYNTGQCFHWKIRINQVMIGKFSKYIQCSILIQDVAEIPPI